MTTIYWAVKLNDDNKNYLLQSFPPAHEKIYAEHMTIVFRPTTEQNKKLEQVIGQEVELEVVGYAEDENGQAIVVKGYDRLDDGIPHITISCRNDIKPSYSNSLLLRGYESSYLVKVKGRIAKFTNEGWVNESSQN